MTKSVGVLSIAALLVSGCLNTPPSGATETQIDEFSGLTTNRVQISPTTELVRILEENKPPQYTLIVTMASDGNQAHYNKCIFVCDDGKFTLKGDSTMGQEALGVIRTAWFETVIFPIEPGQIEMVGKAKAAKYRVYGKNETLNPWELKSDQKAAVRKFHSGFISKD